MTQHPSLCQKSFFLDLLIIIFLPLSRFFFGALLLLLLLRCSFHFFNTGCTIFGEGGREISLRSTYESGGSGGGECLLFSPSPSSRPVIGGGGEGREGNLTRQRQCESTKKVKEIKSCKEFMLDGHYSCIWCLGFWVYLFLQFFLSRSASRLPCAEGRVSLCTGTRALLPRCPAAAWMSLRWDVSEWEHKQAHLSAERRRRRRSRGRRGKFFTKSPPPPLFYNLSSQLCGV